MKEVKEELGITAGREDLRFIGFHEGYVEKDSLVFRESEVEQDLFMDYERCLNG